MNCGRMMPPCSYEEMCADLANSFMTPELSPSHLSFVRLVGLLFARLKSPFVAAEMIIPSLRHFNQRSGRNINFYCAGFQWGWDPENTSEDYILSAYSDAAFDNFRKDMQGRCKWKYSGGADLLLANAVFDGQRAAIDFSSMIIANLVKMKSDGAIDSVESFFEEIFQYAEEQDGRDPAWGFSDSRAKSLGRSALKNLVISLMPEWLRADSRRAFHFVVSDLSLDKPKQKRRDS